MRCLSIHASTQVSSPRQRLCPVNHLLRFRRLNIQAGTQFCDSEFTKEVASGRLSASSLERYTCVALAGVVTEYLRFGQAEGGLGDVLQLDAMFRALQVWGAGQGTAISVSRRAVAPCDL